MERFGATPEAWDHFSTKLGLTKHLLPVVSNPNATISPNSNMRDLGKTPSIYNRDGLAVGFPKWTQYRTTYQDVDRWKQRPDYGICIQARGVRAFDLDTEFAADFQLLIYAATGVHLPARRRRDSNRLLLAFLYAEPLTKRVVPVDGGMVEVLADGQQFIAEGTHPKGARYEWEGGRPESFPELTPAQFEAAWQALLTMSTGEARIARERRTRTDENLNLEDPVADWLLKNWETYDVGPDGQLFIECPYREEHTSDSGPSSTAYFPAGTGGYQQGHFVCLHAHCAGRSDRDYETATGYALAQFDDLGGVPEGAGRSGSAGPGEAPAASGGDAGRPAGMAGPEADTPRSTEDPAWPKLKRDAKGLIEPTAGNLVLAIASGRMIGKTLAYDAFTDSLLWRPWSTEQAWRRFVDADSVAVRIELEGRGFKPMGRELLRDCISASAHQNTIDTAQDWLNSLRWDGVSRIGQFASQVWGWEDTPYANAVGRYLWTALAGRVLQPGVRADMVPILVGAQGIRKTTLIQHMAPDEEMYTEIKLDERDADVSRKLRGKIVGELEELRGLNSRSIEEIKAFITRRREAWVPKFKEFENFFWRRLIFVGTTNEGEILADPTGERRFLPGRCGQIDVEYLIEHRDQLWAEGAAMFALDGVDWQDAERLAKAEHYKFKIGDTWQRRIGAWLADEDVAGNTPLSKGYVTVDEVLTLAIGVPLVQQNRAAELRVARALQHLGLKGDGARYSRD